MLTRPKRDPAASRSYRYKFFDSSSNSLSGTVSKSEHVYPVDTNNIDIFTTALREIVRQRTLAAKRGISASAAGPSRSPANRIASCIGQIFIDFHLKPPSTLLDSASAKTLIVLLAPCPHSALDLYSFITSEEDHIRQKTHGSAGLSMNDVGVVTRSKFANIFNSLGDKLKSVQSQLIWLDTREAMNLHGSETGGFKFSPFDAKEVVHISPEEKKEAPNFGFNTMTQCLAELKAGQIASLVSFETALVLDANNMFSMRSLLLEHVISSSNSSAAPPHINVFPAALFMLEKPPRSASSTTDNPLLLCDSLELRSLATSAAPLWVNARLLSAESSSSKKSHQSDSSSAQASVFQVHFAYDDRKSQLLQVKSAAPNNMMTENAASSLSSSSSSTAQLQILKFSIRGLIRNVHVSPAWIAGSTMILVPSATASSASNDDQQIQQAPLSPRKVPARLASSLYRPPPQSPVFASFLAWLAAEDSCAVIDLPATSFLLTPATATSAFVVPLNDALQVLTKQISAFNNASMSGSSKRAQQLPVTQQQHQRPMTRQSNPNPTLKSLFPPGFYHTADSAALNPNLMLDFSQTNLRLPSASSKPTTYHLSSSALDKIAESYHSRISSLVNKGDPNKQQRNQKGAAPADDDNDDDDALVTFRKEDSGDEAEDEIANMVNLYDKLALSTGGGSGEVEASLLKEIERVVFAAHVNQSDFDGVPVGKAISQALLKPLSALLGPSSSDEEEAQTAQPALRKLRERRLQVALRLESCRNGDLSLDSRAVRRSPRRHAPPSPTKNSSSSTSGSTRPKLSALLELDATIRDEILQLLESIRLFLDAEREQGFVSYFSGVLVDTWLIKCPFTLFWLWRKLELEKSLMPENLNSAVAILFPNSSAASNKRLVANQATPRTGPRRSLSADLNLSFDDGIDSVSKLSDEMMDTSPLADLSSRPQRQLRSKRKLALLEDTPTPSPSLSALDFGESAKRRKLLDAQERLSSLSSSSASIPAQPPTQPLSRSGSGVSTRSKQLAESLSFSAEDILNKFIPTTIAHTKPQTEVKYIPKPRPTKSPPKSPQRPTRSYSTSQLNFSYRK